MRRCLINAIFAVAFTFSAPALAQDASCPPGSWFCESVPERPAPAPEADPDVEAPPPPESLPQPPKQRKIPQFESRPAPPPVVVYRPASPSAPPPRAQVVIVAPGAAPPPPPPARKVVVVRQTTAAPVEAPVPVEKPKRWHRRWGLNLRMEGASFGGPDKGSAEDAGMGGVGLSLRYRPVPAFAIDAGIDVLGGTDFNGYTRTEVPFSLSGMLYVNPRSRLQFYLLAGGHVSHAEVETDTYEPLRDTDSSASTVQYSYVGGHGGLGLEFRLSRLIAFNVDALAFVRKRTDDGLTTPEFTDPISGKTTNMSGGGLFRGGLTFWW